MVMLTSPPDLQISDPALVRFYSYWDGKRGGRRYPGRRDIGPLDLPYILGSIILVDVSHDPVRFRFRLYGSNLVEQTGFDPTGLELSEHPHPQFRAHTDEEWRRTVDLGTPTYSEYDGWYDDRRFRMKVLRLPLSSEGDKIDMLLVAIASLNVDLRETDPLPKILAADT